jgi:AcrR family transcriptional regulator
VNLDSPRRGQRGARVALRTQMREAVRAAILDAAEELIAAKGMHAAALVQIAKKAGVAVGTLYNYFTDRDALIRALFESRRATLHPKILQAIADGRELPFEARLRRVVRGVLAAFEAHRRYVKVMIETEHLKLAPSTTAKEIHAALEEVAQAGAKEGVIGMVQAELLAMLVAGAIRGIVLRRTEDGGDFLAQADDVVSLVLDGARR